MNSRTRRFAGSPTGPARRAGGLAILRSGHWDLNLFGPLGPGKGKNAMRIRILAVALLPGLLGANCELVTKAPLSDPLKAEPDASLLGHWVQSKLENGKARELHLFVGRHSVKGNPNSIMEAVMIEWHKDEQKIVPDRSYYFTTARIGESSYLSMLKVEDIPVQLKTPGSYETWTKSEKRRCTILRYECSAGKLSLWNVNEKALDKLQKDGHLKETDGAIAVDELGQYLRKNGGEELFGDKPLLLLKGQ
jgi:hypothetical protein